MDLRLLIVTASCAIACGRIDFQVGGQGDGGPVPTCAGHDEDGDGFPDACDVCPTVADPLQLDLGERMAGNAPDGIGDACDPRPTLPGDYVLVAEMHVGAGTTTYYALNGTFEWRGDALRLGSLTAFGQADYMLSSSRLTRLEIRAHVIDASPAAPQWFGIWYDGSGPSNEVFAQGELAPGVDPSTSFTLKEESASPDRLSTRVFGAPTFAPGQEWNFVVETALATGTVDVFTVTDGTGQQLMTNLGLLVPPSGTGFLEANAMIVDIDHFVVYAVP